MRTTAFAFHMGARADETWPAHAEESYEAMAKLSSLVLADEDDIVPLLSQQLGVAWPREGLAFDAVYRRGALPCDGALASRLELDPSNDTPATFFACVLERSMGRLATESAILRGMAGDDDTRPAAATHYRCIATYAVVAVMVVRAPAEARALEAPLRRVCTDRELQWVAQRWIRRVQAIVTAEAFGAQAAQDLAGLGHPPDARISPNIRPAAAPSRLKE